MEEAFGELGSAEHSLPFLCRCGFGVLGCWKEAESRSEAVQPREAPRVVPLTPELSSIARFSVRKAAQGFARVQKAFLPALCGIASITAAFGRPAVCGGSLCCRMAAAGSLGRAEQPLPEAPHGEGCSAPADCREAAALRRCVQGVCGECRAVLTGHKTRRGIFDRKNGKCSLKLA